MTGMEIKRARGKCIANALVCQLCWTFFVILVLLLVINFRHFWTKVHHNERACAGEIAVCNAFFHYTISCPGIFATKLRSCLKCVRNFDVLGPQNHFGEGPVISGPIFTVRRSALHGLSHRICLSVCLSVRLSVCLSHSWTVSTWFDLRSWFLHHMVAPSF